MSKRKQPKRTPKPAPAGRQPSKAAARQPREHRTVNLGLLAASVALLAVLVVGVQLLRQHRKSQLSAYLLGRAEQRAGDGDWVKASAYQRRYLKFRPDDFPARMRLVEITKELVAAGEPRQGFIRLLYQTIGIAGEDASSDKTRMRSWLAEQLLATRDLRAAARESQKVIESGVEEHRASALRVAALARLAEVSRRGGLTEAERRDLYSKAFPDFVEAIEANPQDVTLAEQTAAMYREYPLLEIGEDRNAAEIADRIIDQLVERLPQSADALVARYKYRKLNRLKHAQDDLRAALAADPDHFEANLRSGIEANLAVDAGSLEASEAYYRKAIEVRPEAEQPYLLLSQLLRRTGDREGAVEILEQSATSLPPTALAVKFVQADFLIADNRLDEAGPLVAKLRQQFDSQLSRLPALQRARLANRLQLLEARLSSAAGDVVSALSLFKAVALSPGETTDRAIAGVARQANQGAARLLAGLGHWDQVAQELSQLADRLADEIDEDSNKSAFQYELLGASEAIRAEYRSARVQSAEAYLRSGQAGKARSELEALEKDQGLTTEALETRLLVELRVQLDSVPGKRRWDEFNYLFEKAQRELPGSLRVWLVELSRLQADSTASDEVAALVERLLLDGSERFADSGAYWRAAAKAYLELNKPARSESAVRRFLDVEPGRLTRAEVWVSYLVAAGRADEAREWLSNEIASAPAEINSSLRQLEVKLLVSSGEKEEALKNAEELALVAGDKSTLTLALELAIAQREWELAARLEKKIADGNLLPPADVNYYKAVRQVSNFDTLSTEEKADLSKLVAALRTARPLWRRGATLAARYAEAKGDPERAIEAYELAIALGDRAPQTLENLTLHLYRSAKYDRAQQVIDRLFSQGSDLSLGAESLAISTAVKRRRLDDARRLAEASVADHPDDPARRLWLHNVLLVDGQGEEAGRVLAEARQDFPDDAMIWNAQFNHFLREQERGAAKELLGSLPPSIEGDAHNRSLALAQGYQLLGSTEEAKRNYQLAIDHKPRDIDVRLRYAELLLTADSAQAQRELEAVLELEPDNADARRKLASLLATNGPGSDWTRIDELLAGAETSSDVLDRRLRAVLLTRRGRSIEERAGNCELARRILQGVVEDSQRGPEAIDRLLLAGAYEQEGVLKQDPAYFESARRQLRMLVDRQGASAEKKSLYLSYLFRSIEALADMEESASARSAFLEDARERVESARGDFEKSPAADNALARQSLIGVEVRLLKAEGRDEEAIAKLGAYAEDHVRDVSDEAVRPRLILGLATLYTHIAAHELAEPWYRELVSLAPGARSLLSQSLIQQGRAIDAVNLFLESTSAEVTPGGAAALAGVLATSGSDNAAFDKAWPAIAGALEQHGDDVELLMSTAVLQVTRGNQDAAIRLFRRVLELSPKHVLALNNLATLLGEREGYRDEALEVIGRAIEVAGRKAALLDTQGTIQLQLGDAEAAIVSLEESVITVNVDPRYYFHLAAAYLRGGMIERAREALGEARRRGIDKAVLTSADRALMREIESRLSETTTASNQAA